MKLSSKKRKIIARYFRSKPVKAVYLFGSFARGDADSESDIDLLIERDLEGFRQINVSRYRQELKTLLSCKIDISQYYRLRKRWPAAALEESMKECILIYREEQPI